MDLKERFAPTILGKPRLLFDFYDKVEFTHEAPPAMRLASNTAQPHIL